MRHVGPRVSTVATGVILTVGVLITGAILSACGTSPTSGAAAASPARTASLKSPLRIGFECSCTGAEASSIAIQAHVLSGWAAYENAHGGIAGHSVDLITMNDGLDPATSLAQVTKMVSQDHVLAIIDGSDVDSSWAPYVEKTGIPVFVANLSSSLAYSNPDFFPPGQTINTLATSIALAAQKARVTSLATVYCSEDPVCASLAPVIAKAAQVEHIKAPYSGPISASAPNYAAPCLAAKQAGANGIFVGQASQVVISFASSCTAQGYRPKYLAESTAISTAFLSSSELNGMVGIQNDLPAFVTSNPVIRTMTNALRRYSPGTLSSPDYSPGITMVWAAAMLFAASAQHLRGEPTAKKILSGLYSLHNTTLGGIAPPLTFHRGKPTTIGCWFYMSVKNHRFTMPYGQHPTCRSGSR